MLEILSFTCPCAYLCMHDTIRNVGTLSGLKRNLALLGQS